MIRRLLNLLMAFLLILAGPSAMWAAMVPTEPSCCGGPVCPCPPPPRPAPPAPVSPTPPAPMSQVQAQTSQQPKQKASEPTAFPPTFEVRPFLVAEPLTASDVPDPPDGTRRQSLLGVFRN